MKPIRYFQPAFLALLLPCAGFATETETWLLAKATIERIGNGELPSRICDPARQEFFLLLIDDSESIVIFEHPDGRCLVGFPRESIDVSEGKTRMVASEPLIATDGGRPVIWVGATLDKEGSTPEFFKLRMVRNTGTATDTLFLRRKGKGPLVQWILS